MMWLYTGTPGSGKSLHVANLIYWKIRAGRPVIANFEIQVNKIKTKNKKRFKYVNNFELTPQVLINYSREYFGEKRVKEDAILLVIDECQLMFNAREWNKKGRFEWISFFTQHRKFGYQIVLVTQFDSMIDKQVRSLVEYQCIHRKVSNFGLAGKIMSLVALGNLFCSVTVWYPMKERTGATWFGARKKYYQLYDTFMMFDGNGTDEVAALPATGHTQT